MDAAIQQCNLQMDFFNFAKINKLATYLFSDKFNRTKNNNRNLQTRNGFLKIYLLPVCFTKLNVT